MSAGDSCGASLPLVSVVVPTRNRPDQVAECVSAILRCADEHFNVTVADQSDDNRTAAVVATLDDPRIVHLRVASRGAANARNAGAAHSTGEIVAFTDDDCRVDSGWITALRRMFDQSGVALVFGSVVTGPPPEPRAYAAEFAPGRTRVIGSLPSAGEPWGISASMAIRRDAFDRIHVFDPQLGPGARIDSGGEDSDLLIRVLAGGFRVGLTAETHVTHLGFRTGEQARDLYRGYGYALGAVFMKHLRLRTPDARSQLWKWLALFSAQTVRNGLRRRQPTGLGFSIGLLKGAMATVRTPIDASTGLFA